MPSPTPPNVLVSQPATGSGSNTLTIPSIVNFQQPTVQAPTQPHKLSYVVRHPIWQLLYKGRDITGDIIDLVTEVSYKNGAKNPSAPTHRKHRTVRGMADEIEILVEDRDKRWQGPWFPTRGDGVHLNMGYQGESLKDCGDFQVDELELKGPPDALNMKCIAAGITDALRTPRDAAYESTTLLGVANTIAQRHGLALYGAPADINIEWARLSQHKQTDLNYLHGLALDHGYDFTIKGKKLIFWSRAAQEKEPAIVTLTRPVIKEFSFTEKTGQVYKSATITYQEPHGKTLVHYTAEDLNHPTGDDLHIVERAETPHHARLKAENMLHDANMLQTTTKLTLEGTPPLVAGVNIAIRGFGVFDGIYHIEASTHRLERSSGYITEIEGRKL